MSEKAVYKLKINMEFKNLIRPLQKKEFLQLESNILSDGCRDPIVTWKGFIVDGHNRYEICTEHQIPFEILEMDFECKEAAIAWICANQLGRRNITEETRKFLIGMQYETEKVVASRRNVQGTNQYSCQGAGIQRLTEAERQAASGHLTAQKIADENHISQGTVQKYAMYTRALEEIGKICPALIPKILSGRYKISHKNLLELSRMSPEEMKKVVRKIEVTQQPFVKYNTTRQEVQRSTGLFGRTANTGPSVKDMPAFDPDAEITGLTLTIPSWASSIDRTRSKADLRIVSDKARGRLAEALTELQDKVSEMLAALKEE